MRFETAELISKMVGNKTVKQYSTNKPKFLDLNPASRSLHESETQRALLLPQEVMNLPRDEQILLIESSPPIKSKKIFYFKDPFFKRRLLPQIDIPEQEPYDPRKFRAEEQPQDNADGDKPQVEDPGELPDQIDDYTGGDNNAGGSLPAPDVDMGDYVPDVSQEDAEKKGFGEFRLDDDEYEADEEESSERPPEDDQEGDDA